MRRLAFTMLELVMVIVVLGILAAVSIPKLDNDIRTGARENIYSALQYTRQLALVDNKTDPANARWQQRLWTMRFSSDGDSGFFYTVSSNENTNGGISKEESAIDPSNGKYMFNVNGTNIINGDESPNVFLGTKFGVDSVVFTGGCSGGQSISFDHLGRPFVGGTLATITPDLYSQIMTSDCIITVGFIDTDLDDLVFNISKETGFVQII